MDLGWGCQGCAVIMQGVVGNCKDLDFTQQDENPFEDFLADK